MAWLSLHSYSLYEGMDSGLLFILSSRHVGPWQKEESPSKTQRNLVYMEETKLIVAMGCKILGDKVNVSKPRKGRGRGIGCKLGWWGRGTGGTTGQNLTV